MTRISTEELKRLVAEQDLAEFACPHCGAAVRVTASYTFTAFVDKGKMTLRTKNIEAIQNPLFFQCSSSSCDWDSDGFGDEIVYDALEAQLWELVLGPIT